MQVTGGAPNLISEIIDTCVKFEKFEGIAQLAERRASNAEVVGSLPIALSIFTRSWRNADAPA